MAFEHKPVMANEIIDVIRDVKADGPIVDATLGGGGHSKLILESFNDRKLICIDRDLQAIAAAKGNLKDYLNRVEIIHAGFAQIGEEIRQRNKEREVAAVLFDLGVSSHQLDSKERGFTYRHDDAPLDMRMDSSETLTAEIIVNEYPQEEIERILRENSDERFANKIASEIVKARPLHNAGDLVRAIRQAIPYKFQRIAHPAKRTFQALRMEVNKELNQLQTALDESVHLLAPQGRVLVLSYHSGEDKVVKQTFKKYFGKKSTTADGRVIPNEDTQGYVSSVKLIPVSAPKKPSKSEVEQNPRAKSARLRVAESVDFDKASGM